MRVALSRIHFPVTTLGPGARVAIWLQGCSIRCPGCISLDTWAADRGLTTVDDVIDVVSPFLKEADGVTISGGEPFDQPDALRELLRHVRAQHRGDILVYSGHELETLVPALTGFDGLIDALIADPYRPDSGQTLALRGSDNQRLLCLTDLGQHRFKAFERPLRSDARTLDIMFDEESGTVFMAGIPRPGDMVQLRRLLAEQGHTVSISEDRRTAE